MSLSEYEACKTRHTVYKRALDDLERKSRADPVGTCKDLTESLLRDVTFINELLRERAGYDAIGLSVIDRAKMNALTQEERIGLTRAAALCRQYIEYLWCLLPVCNDTKQPNPVGARVALDVLLNIARTSQFRDFAHLTRVDMPDSLRQWSLENMVAWDDANATADAARYRRRVTNGRQERAAAEVFESRKGDALLAWSKLKDAQASPATGANSINSAITSQARSAIRPYSAVKHEAPWPTNPQTGHKFDPADNRQSPLDEQLIDREGLARLAAGEANDAALSKLLQNLPKRRRQVLVLHAGGRTAGEIAAELSITISTVYTHLRDAAKDMEKYIQK